MAVLAALPSTYQVSTHTSCVCNEAQALFNRHLVEVGPFVVDNVTYSDSMREAYMKQVFEHLPIPEYTKMSKYEMAMSYAGAKRRSYLKGYAELKSSPSMRAMTRIKMFVKAEKYPTADVGSKAPRAIQFRSASFNLLVGAHLKPYEHAMYQALTSNIGMRVVAKGLNNYQRASNIVEASKHFRNPRYFLLDHSKFDAHVSVAHLKWLHRQYYRATKSKQLRWLMHHCIKNRGYTSNGIKYTVNGTRMSGDFDTALGNTLLNFAMIKSWLGAVKSHILLDGDDSVVVVETTQVEELNRRLCHFTKLGMNTKCELVKELHEVEFCRAKLLPVDPPRFGRDPIRGLSNMTMFEKDYTGKARMQYIAGLGVGGLAANAGVPVMQAASVAFARAHHNPMLLEEYLVRYGPPMRPQPITHEVREWYHQQWGITPYEQELIESQIATPTWYSDNLLGNYQSLCLSSSQL